MGLVLLRIVDHLILTLQQTLRLLILQHIHRTSMVIMVTR
jgi:hypothetical protein